MSNLSKIILGFAFATIIAGCAREQEEVVYVEPAPIPAEPTYSKY